MPELNTASNGTIFDIKRFAIHDGPGIRTTVFFKGCPLHCLWCHNPESINSEIEVMYYPDRCINCGNCATVCPKHHSMESGKHIYSRVNNCEDCIDAACQCPSNALEISGYIIDVDTVVKEVLKDIAVYKKSGGGVTFSGGEPVMQTTFLKSLVSSINRKKLHMCLDTSGHYGYEKLDGIKENIDIFLFDIKETAPEKHRDLTGVSNELIMENLFRLGDEGKKIILRCPIAEGINDRHEHLRRVAEISMAIQTVEEINILPYHAIGQSKWEALGKKYKMKSIRRPSEDKVKEWVSIIQNMTEKPTKSS